MASTPSLSPKTANPQPGTHVRSLNPNYRREGVGRVLKVHNEICKVEFNPSVFSRQPHRFINYLLTVPALEFCPPPLELAKAGQSDVPWKFDLRQMAARLLIANKGGQLSNARTEILPHHVFTTFSVVSNSERRL